MPTRPGPFGPGDSIGRITPTGPGAKGPVESVRPPVITPGRGGMESVRPPMTTRTDTGIHGGTPAQGQTGPGRGTSRGLVVGGERQVTGHGMMGGSTGGHGGSVGRPNGLGGSQRLVTEPGGTVRTPRGTQAGAGREFTQGGTGLVRESTRSGGAMGPMGGAMGGSQGTGRRSQRRDGESPDYLAEDEETWGTGDNGVVPPVID